MRVDRLTRKVERAFISYLKTNDVLRGYMLEQERTDSIKKDGTVVVKATAGEEIGSGTNVRECEVEIEMSFKVRPRNTMSQSDQEKALEAIEAMLSIGPIELSKELTEQEDNFHCYYYRLEDSGDASTDEEFSTIWTCVVTVMGVNFNK